MDSIQRHERGLYSDTERLSAAYLARLLNHGSDDLRNNQAKLRVLLAGHLPPPVGGIGT